MGNYRPFLQGALPVANYTRIIIPGRFWTRPPSTKSTRMASSATPLHDLLIELAIPDAHAHATKWYLKPTYSIQSSSCSGKWNLPVTLIVDLSLARVVQHSPFQFYASSCPSADQIDDAVQAHAHDDHYLTRSKFNSLLTPPQTDNIILYYNSYPRERGPMGGAPYIGARMGGGPIFEVSVSHLYAKERPGKLPTLAS